MDIFYEKQELKEYFENKVQSLIVHTLDSYKGIEFFTKLNDIDEFVLRKDIKFFAQSYRDVLERSLNLSFKLFNILPNYLNQLRKFLSDHDKLSSKKIDEQLKKVRDSRKILDGTSKYLASWIEESEKYYADRLETFTIETETGQMDVPVDSTLGMGKFFFINPLRIQINIPYYNINKLSEISEFIKEIWQSHFEFFFSEDGTELDTTIHGISKVERRFNILKEQPRR